MSAPALPSGALLSRLVDLTSADQPLLTRTPPEGGSPSTGIPTEPLGGVCPSHSLWAMGREDSLSPPHGDEELRLGAK